jgi:dipeptidase D
MKSAIDGLRPEPLWRYFAELSAIPRGSKHEEKATAYVAGVARRLGLEAVTDACGNVVVRKKAAKGRENAAAIVVQSHLDMVCEKNAGTVHNFDRDPLVLRRQGNCITATGTTLGADNGIGVAAGLALMEDAAVRHGPLELLFTVDEETGLTGANNLRSDFLQSRILINLDSEEEGVLCVGCAGGMDSRGEVPVAFEPLPPKHRLFRLKAAGLRGGHSGLDIHRGRGNAIKLLGRALQALVSCGVRLASIEGGNKRNAIPREAAATIALPEKSFDDAFAGMSALAGIFKAEFAATDPGVELTLEKLRSGKGPVMKRASAKAILNLLSVLPHGVIRMHAAIPGLVQTSTNLARVATTKKSVVVETSQRSSVESEKAEIVATVCAAFDLVGAGVSHGDGYSGWQPNLVSPILKTAQAVYRAKYGKDPDVKAIHAGLECGIIGDKFPGMDMLSLGPTLEFVHSPAERVPVDSVERVWDFLVAILETVGKENKELLR